MKAHLYSILMLASLFFGLAACDKPANDFRLSGDCQVISLALDEDFEGMTITDLTLSDGATADKHVGDRLNLSTPQAIRVKNGDVMMEYTLSVKHDEARILSFIINGQYVGVIDQSAHTISVLVPAGSNLHSLTPTVTTTDGATLLPASGVVQDFSQPVLYTVSYNTASLTYLVTVAEMTSPHVLYVGLADTRQQLPVEEQTACSWLLTSGFASSRRASFAMKAVSFVPFDASTPSTQYATGLNAATSRSRSTRSRRATDCTRPAERE